MSNFHPPEAVASILSNRYFQKNEDWNALCRRVAAGAASTEPEELREEWEQKFYTLINQGLGLPNTPALVNLGANHTGSVAACFSFRPDDHMDSIMEVSRLAAMTLKFGGGAGFELSKLRPAGSLIQSTHKHAMGPIGVMKFYNAVGDMITQAGIRKAALIAILRIDHPDVVKFCRAKLEDKALANFNISVSIPDGFMKKLTKEPDKPHVCRFNNKQYHILSNGEPILRAERGSKKVLSVREIYDLLCEGGAANGDPGVFFVDHVNRDNPLIDGINDIDNPFYMAGSNPCLSGSSKLWTNKGYLSIAEIYEDKPEDLLAITPYGRREISVVCNGERETVKVTTNIDEIEIVCTPDHLFLTVEKEEPLVFRNSEWVQAKDLRGKYVKAAIFNGGAALVTNIEPVGKELVYDFSIIGETNFDRQCSWVNNLTTHNCSELPLSHMEACILGSIDLNKFVVDKELDTTSLTTAFRTMTRLLEDMIDASAWPDPQIEEKVHQTRRIGAGIMGFASMLDKMEIRYGSEECMKLIDIIGTIRETACSEESKQLAKERGTYPAAPEGEKHRNVARLTLAPTGTLAMIANTSWSLEPHLYWAFEERRNDEVRIRYLPAVEEYIPREELEELVDTANGDLIHLNDLIQAKLPIHMVRAKEITPDEHLKIVAAWQKYTDSSISKCLSKGTLIYTNKGILPIEKLGHASKPEETAPPLDGLEVLDKDGLPRKVKAHYCAGSLPARKIRLSDGSSLSGAKNTHKVLTPNGWKTLKDLKIGDPVFVKRNYHFFNNPGEELISSVEKHKNCLPITIPEKMSTSLAKWLGMVAADGYIITKPRCSWVQLTEKNSKVGDLFNFLTEDIFKKNPKISEDKRNGVVSHTIHSSPLAHWTEALIGKGSKTKHVPKQILCGSREEKIAFVEGLSLDGYALRQGSGGLVVYEGVSKRLRDETAEILKSLGIPQVNKHEKRVYGRDYYCYSVEVRNELQEVITPIEKHKDIVASDKKYLVGLDPVEIENTKIPFSNPYYRTWRNLRNRGNVHCWSTTARNLGLKILGQVEKVTLIEDIGTVPMFDIEVEKNHSYIVDGIISHNTICAPAEVLNKEAVGRIYQTAWENKLKGITVYPEGSREGEPMSVGKKKKKIEKSLPQSLKSDRHEFQVQLGNKMRKVFAFVGLDPKEERHPVEVFLKHPYVQDPMAIQFIDLTTRLLSLALRYRTCPECGEEVIPLGKIIKQLRETDGQSMFSVPSIFVKALGKYLSQGESVGTCPSPGCNGNLTLIEGCESCVSCGFRSCG